MIRIINHLDANKASGPYSIDYEILHLIKLIIAEPLSRIINLSFEKAKYFDNLKISKAIPVYKDKGSNLDSGNYRPISLLSNINKIVEKLMYNRLHSFLSKHDNHSTIHALISLTEHTRDSLDQNKIACGIFIDLQKAFDTVDHSILLDKLAHYGIRGIANDWFRSYLSNSQQHVSINGHDSNKVVMKHGVPQGSVLGPLVFLIYINDQHKSIKYCSVRHFADDTNLLILILISNNSPKKIQDHVN